MSTKRKLPKPVVGEPLGQLPAFISLGAGVQSTTMILLAEHGEIPRPEAAIFADTQWEPKAVYEHLAWLERTVKNVEIIRVTRGDIRENIMAASRGEGSIHNTRYASPPLHFKDPDGFGMRQCTNQFKLVPIVAELKRRGFGRYKPCEQWLGISMDEIQRMKGSRTAWQVTRWPLIELGMSRNDCLSWLREKGYPEPPKSACIGCPLHANHQWRDLKVNSPGEWEDAVEVDEAVRHMEGTAYLHYSKQPLTEVDLRTAEDRGQLSLADDECGGACFV